MASSQAFSRAAVRRVNGGPVEEQFDDLLAVEEPLEIRLGFRWEGKPTHRAISITMRTPGEDADLAAGFLFTEGILRSPDEILQIHHCGLKIGSGKGTIERASALNSNTIRVDLRDDIAVDLKRLERHFYTSSSCGVCGKGSIEAVGTGVEKLPETGFVVRRDVIHQLPEQLRRAQSVFDETGGLHSMFKVEC